jgi:hypothetical protein
LLGKANIIQHQHPLAQRGLPDHLLYSLPVEGLLDPWHVGEELLPPLLARPGDRLGHGVTVFVGQFSQQPSGIALQGFHNLGEFKATGDMQVGRNAWLVAKKDTPYELWNRLLGIETPEHSQRPE